MLPKNIGLGKNVKTLSKTMLSPIDNDRSSKLTHLFMYTKKVHCNKLFFPGNTVSMGLMD